MVLNEFLVALGLKDNMSKQLEKATKDADKKVGKFVTGFAKNFAVAGAAVAGLVTVTATGLFKFTNNLLKADDELTKFSRNMGLPREEAYKVKSALDVMGKSMEEIALDPNLLKQFEQLKANAESLKMPDLTDALKPFREMLSTFNEIKQTATNALQWVGYYFLKYVQAPMENIKKLFSGFNETIKKNIPAWSSNIAKALAWLVRLGGTVIRGAGLIFNVIKRIFDMMPVGVKATMGILGVLFAFVKASPLGKMMMLITALILILDDFFTFLDGGGSVIGDFLEKLGISADDVRAFMTKTWETIETTLKNIWKAIAGFATAIWNGLTEFWKKNGDTIIKTLLTVWNSLKTTLIALWEFISTAAVVIFNGLKAYWQTWGDTILHTIVVVWKLIANTIKNTLDIISGVLRLFTAIFKGDWETAWVSVKDIASAIWKQITSIFTTAKDLIAGAFSKLYDIIGPFAAVIAGVAAAVGAYMAVTKATAIVQGIMAVATKGLTVAEIAKTVATKAAAAAQWLLNAAMTANPIGIVIALIAGLVAGFVLLWNKSEGFRNFFIGMWEGIKKAFGAVVDWFKKNWQALILFLINPVAGLFKYFYDNFEGFRNVVDNVIGAVKQLFADLWGNIKNGLQAFADFFIAIWQAISGFFKGIWDGIAGTVSVVVDKIMGFLKPILDTIGAVKNAVGGVASSAIGGVKNFVGGLFGGHAEGGVFDKEHVANFAEGDQPEAVIPLSKPKRATEVMQQALDFMGGGSATAKQSETAAAPIERLIEKLNSIMERLASAISSLAATIQNTIGKLSPKEESGNNIVSAIGGAISKLSSGLPSGFTDQFAQFSAKMNEFLDNANKVIGQMGQATNAAHSTTNNNNISYDNRSYDQKSTFNINDMSGEPRVVADMVDRTQSLRIRNMRGAFA